MCFMDNAVQVGPSERFDQPESPARPVQASGINESGGLQPLALDDLRPPLHPKLPHVLLVVDQFPKSLGGGERFVLRLAELLPQYGFRASVLTFAIHPESSVLAADRPFPVYLLPLQRTYDLNAVRSGWALGRFLRRQKIDLVQTFFESSDLWGGAVVKALSNAKLIWSRRDMGILRSGKHRLAYRLARSMPDQVFAVSEQVRRHVIEVDAVDPDKVRTIYTGIDVQGWERPQPEYPTRYIRVTTIGNIRGVKGHDLLVRAAALVQQHFPNTFFSIAGDVLEPGYYAELQRLVRDLGMADRFSFAGPVLDTQAHLAQADLFVLPSRSEGFSNAILEAMACSLPVIASDVGGNSEAVQHGRTGLIIPSEDVAALALAIMRLAGDRNEARQMGVAGRMLVEEKFSTRAMMVQTATAYDEVISSKKK